MISIYTYNDLIKVGDGEEARKDFILKAIESHTTSEKFRIASDANDYYNHLNPTINRFQKYVYNKFAQKVPDIWSANNKIASNWYFYFTVQAIQYLLGNGVSFGQKQTKDKLGKDFDSKIQLLARYAKNGSCSYGFWNLDHIDVFSFTEFVPLYDEEDGTLKAGIRFWQIDSSKPMIVDLFELDGVTEYKKNQDDDKLEISVEKKPYKTIVSVSEADGEKIVGGENYPSFPIVPLHNVNDQSDIVGNQNTIDAYDLMISGLINNVSDGEFIYWILKNCGGMNENDDVKFIEQLKLTHVAHADGDEGASVDAHQVDVPFEASAEALERLENQLYKDFMGLNVQKIAAQNVTATQIKAAYEPLNLKTDAFEYQVTDFINHILALAGIDDEPTFNRSKTYNISEEIQTILQSSEYLGDEETTRQICSILGIADRYDDIMKNRSDEELGRFKEKENEEE